MTATVYLSVLVAILHTPHLCKEHPSVPLLMLDGALDPPPFPLFPPMGGRVSVCLPAWYRQCDCGDGVSCGEYLFNHLNGTKLTSWFTEECAGMPPPLLDRLA